MEESDVVLQDGRTLAYTDCGDPGGPPVLSFHGTPSCRFPGPWEAAARSVGVRLISPDRPGYGRSDFHPGQKLLDWPADAAELADSLELRSFAVVGTSGGGPYAAACAYALPERVSAAALVCGVGPFWDVPEVDACATAEAGGWLRELIDLARVDPAAAVAHAREECEQDAEMVARDPEEWLRFWFESEDVPAPDREVVARPDDREALVFTLREALRPGIEGYVQDELILAIQPWGFRPQEIRVPVSIWHGELDRLVPVGAARYLARVIPHSSARFLPGDAHMIHIRHAEEIFGGLVDVMSPVRS